MFWVEVAEMPEVSMDEGTARSSLEDRPPPFLFTIIQTRVVQTFAVLSDFPAHVGKFRFGCCGARQGTVFLLGSQVLLLVYTQHFE